MMTSRMIHHQFAVVPVVPPGAGVAGVVVCASADDTTRKVRAIQEMWRIFPPRVMPDAMTLPAVRPAHAALGPILPRPCRLSRKRPMRGSAFRGIREAVLRKRGLPAEQRKLTGPAPTREVSSDRTWRCPPLLESCAQNLLKERSSAAR